MAMFWLSFADPKRPKGTQFLGAAIVEASTFDLAIREAWHRGVNPGGEVQGIAIDKADADRVPREWVNRLLNRQQCLEFDATLTKIKAH